MSRTFLVLLAWDHMILATATWGKCLPYEMISSALWTLERDGKIMGVLLRPVVDMFLSPRKRNHCHESYLWQEHLYKAPK